MADSSDINFKLTTEADTTGAEEMEKSIFKVQDAAKQAAEQADVDAIKAKQAEAAQKVQVELLKELADGQQRIIAAGLAKELSKISRGFGAISPEATLAVNATQNFLTVIATTGNPITALLALTATAIGGVTKAYNDAAAQQKQLSKDEEESLKKLRAAREEYATFIRTQGLVQFFKQELDQLEEQEKVLGRIVKIAASERALAAQRQATSGAAAVASGADASGAAAQNLDTNTNNQVAALNDKLAQSQLAVTNAVKKADDLELESKALATAGHVGEDAVKAAKEADEARKKATELTADLAADREVTNNQIQTILEASKASQAKIAEDSGKQLAEGAKAEVEKIKAASEKSGNAISSQAKAGIDTITELAKDGIIKPEEMARLRDALQRIYNSRERSDTEVAKGLETLMKGNEAFIRIVQPLGARLAAQERQIADLETALRGQN